jgi:hypothetical protein
MIARMMAEVAVNSPKPPGIPPPGGCHPAHKYFEKKPWDELSTNVSYSAILQHIVIEKYSTWRRLLESSRRVDDSPDDSFLTGHRYF